MKGLTAVSVCTLLVVAVIATVIGIYRLADWSEPAILPTNEPTVTAEQTAEPTITNDPTADPTVTTEPTGEPTITNDLTGEPTTTNDPTSEPTVTAEPTVEPPTTPPDTEESVHITYVLGSELFRTREELFRAFFGEFYEFVRSNGGEAGLYADGYVSVWDFLGAFEYCVPGSEFLRRFANSYGGYFMRQKANSTLAEQPSYTFLGYCRDNGKWLYLIREFMMYFSCWRTDELYANIYNSGADYFAETWSTFVDTCTYFRYNRYTSTTQTARIYDYFDHPPCVVQGALPDALAAGSELPHELLLRGHRFAGWSLTPGGETVTAVPEGTKAIVLYANWEYDETYQSALSAALVEWQIYNLTTRTARLTPETVAQAKEAYDRLTPEEQLLVTNADVLKELIRLVMDPEN